MSKVNLKKAFAAAIAATLAAPTNVLAEGIGEATGTYTTTDAIIDRALTGSITLYKYLDNDGKSVDAEGVSYAENPADMVGVIRELNEDTSIMPEKGVKFRLLKVADIDQITETKNRLGITGTYYTNFDEDFFEIMNSYLGEDALKASDSTRVSDGRADSSAASEVDDHYESDELNAKMMQVIRSAALPGNADSVTGEVALNRYVRMHTLQEGVCMEFADTDENGFTKLENLPLGLYLICEVDYEHTALSKHDGFWERVDDGIDDALTGDIGNTEDAGNEESGIMAGGANAGGSQYADIASPVSPFLISVPMTNIAEITGEDGVVHQPGTVWQYDIVAYPKNGSINIHKDIVVNDAALTVANGQTYTANDGNDLNDDKTLCDFRQTNYDSLEDDPLTPDTQLDGQHKQGLVHQIDANIGDIITQVVSSDVPVLVDDIDDEFTGANRDNAFRKHNKTYKITDRMTKGLHLIDHNSFRVTLSSSTWDDVDNAQLLQEGTDYTLEIADDYMSFVLTMTEEGLHKMDDLTTASYLYVKYDCELTNDALIGTDTYGTQKIVLKDQPASEDDLSNGTMGTQFTIDTSKEDTAYITADGVEHPDATNQNTAMLTYATDRTMEHDYYSNTTKVFTYEIDLTKMFTDGTQGYVSKNDENQTSFQFKDVKFTVRGSVQEGSVDSLKEDYSNGYEDLIFVKVGDGQYRVWDRFTDGGVYQAETDILDQPADEKTITKFVTPNSQSGLLTLRGLDARTYEFTEVSTAKGRNLMAAKFYCEIIAPVVNEKTLEDGSVEHAYVWSDTKPAADVLADYDLGSFSSNKERMDFGRVPFIVQNNEIIKVLKTGGTGIVALVVTGSAMMSGAVAFLTKKKKEEEEAEA